VEAGVLADEARLVLGPWLDALETCRPYVTWACVLDSGPWPETAEAAEAPAGSVLSRLHAGNDAVLFQDGHVEEGVPDSHGKGILNLIAPPLEAGPGTVLASLYDGGVRSVLLRGRHRLAAPFLHDGFIDEIIAILPADGRYQQQGPAAVSQAAGLLIAPPEFRLVRVEKSTEAVLAVCRKV
jgi:diaminohydroxyphosphoribosylaminopyrimidine deaminase/5-amino-6-(5-phosphoribosylamino)uracil reductase